MGNCLFTSSIGRKLIMSISGLFLVLFLLFHMSMNLAAVFSTEAYNAICEFLGTHWWERWCWPPVSWCTSSMHRS